LAGDNTWVAVDSERALAAAIALAELDAALAGQWPAIKFAILELVALKVDVSALGLGSLNRLAARTPKDVATMQTAANLALLAAEAGSAKPFTMVQPGVKWDSIVKYGGEQPIVPVVASLSVSEREIYNADLRALTMDNHYPMQRWMPWSALEEVVSADPWANPGRSELVG